MKVVVFLLNTLYIWMTFTQHTKSITFALSFADFQTMTNANPSLVARMPNARIRQVLTIANVVMGTAVTARHVQVRKNVQQVVAL